MNYLIYGKTSKMKQFRPISGKHFAVNLIHAEHFETKKEAEQVKKQLEKHNLDIKWEIRKAK